MINLKRPGDSKKPKKKQSERRELGLNRDEIDEVLKRLDRIEAAIESTIKYLDKVIKASEGCDK